MISSYFNRDRSTVMRWARDRDLPIHRIPGGKQGSVFAYTHELAAWAAQRPHDLEEAAEIDPAAQGDAPPSQAAPRRKWLGPAIAAVLAVLAVSGGGYWLAQRPGADAQASRRVPPKDAQAARDYALAKDHWARRTQADLKTAIALYERVIVREPDYAPAYAGLAEAWLILREYGDSSDLEAYGTAQTAAVRALNLDPQLPDAHRALGFIHYWRENDRRRAIASFQQALALDDGDALTHFWYANILSDIGDHQAARRAYDKARALSPGSQTIEVEAACAEWQAGNDDRALMELNALAKRFPQDATIQNCLAWLHMSHGDIHAFAKAFTANAELRGEPGLLRMAQLLNHALTHDPAQARNVLLDEMQRQIALGERRGRETPAFYASALGDRQRLIGLMTEARNIGEIWNSWAITSRIADRWRDDEEVQALLKPLRGPAPETAAAI